MDSVRQNKISRLLLKETGEIFQRESFRLFNGAMITVTEVRASADLSVAKIYLSLFSTINNPQELIDKVNENKSKIRFELGKRVKNQLRKVPELIFYIDDSLDKMERIEKLLKGEDPDKKQYRFIK
ncbi:MAG: 30S ribosome-binding factor RbfA [Bacteroidia bacterium]|nr:30S ribosome-binding factor RbfA [Bacteroidia bacterium]